MSQNLYRRISPLNESTEKEKGKPFDELPLSIANKSNNNLCVYV